MAKSATTGNDESMLTAVAKAVGTTAGIIVSKAAQITAEATKAVNTAKSLATPKKAKATAKKRAPRTAPKKKTRKPAARKGTRKAALSSRAKR